MTRVATNRPLREALGFALPLLALLGIGALGLWRERMAGLAEQDRQLTWLANTAAEQATALLAKEQTAWALGGDAGGAGWHGDRASLVP
jgi:hypothetical protein